MSNERIERVVQNGIGHDNVSVAIDGMWEVLGAPTAELFTIRRFPHYERQHCPGPGVGYAYRTEVRRTRAGAPLPVTCYRGAYIPKVQFTSTVIDGEEETTEWLNFGLDPEIVEMAVISVAEHEARKVGRHEDGEALHRLLDTMHNCRKQRHNLGWPSNLLDACLRATGQQGGTIHDFLPHLRWVQSTRARQVWRLVLQLGATGPNSTCHVYYLALWTQFDASTPPPSIEPELGRCPLPRGFSWWVPSKDAGGS